MTKQDLIKVVQEEIATAFPEVKVTATAAEKVLANIGEKMEAELVAGGSVTIPKIGKVKTKVQKGREGTLNFGPRKGDKFKTEDKTVLTIVQDSKIADKL